MHNVRLSLTRHQGVRTLLGNTRPWEPLARLSRKGLVPVGLWQRLPAYGDFAIKLPWGGSMRMVGATNDWLERCYFWRGMAVDEPETYPVWHALAQEADLVLDIGANVGLFSMLALAANPCCRVIAFEPVPAVRAKVAANVEANGWSDRCLVRGEAVSDSEGKAAFYAARTGMTVFSGLCSDTASTEEGGELLEVSTTTVDFACADEERVGLVKIDVEGHEDGVLRGMTRVLEKYTPDIIMECLPEGPYAEIQDILRGHGYRFYHLQGTGPVETEDILPDEQRRFRNYLCTVRDEPGSLPIFP